MPVEKQEVLDRRSSMALARFVELCDGGLLYSDKELFDMLKVDVQFKKWLKASGYPGLNLVDRTFSTSLQVILHNLWRNGYIRKFATGIFGMSGRPTGVVWEIKREEY